MRLTAIVPLIKLSLICIVQGSHIFTESDLNWLRSKVCQDDASLEVLGVREWRLYFEHNGHQFRVKPDKIRTDWSPQGIRVNRTYYPGQLVLSGKLYHFNNTIRSYFFKANETTWLLIGVNQAWLGCPQPFCLDSTMDAVGRYNQTHYAVYRGTHYWISKDIPSHRQPQVKDQIELPKTVMYVDAATYINGTRYIFKEDDCYLIDESRIEFVEHTSHYLAGANINGDVFMFTGTEYIITHRRGIRIKPNPIVAQNRRPYLTDIEAALFYKATVYIFKQKQMWTLRATTEDTFYTSPAVVPSLTISSFFGCTLEYYNTTVFKSYDNFRQLMVNIKREPVAILPETSTASNTGNINCSTISQNALSSRHSLGQISEAATEAEGVTSVFTIILLSVWVALVVVVVVSFAFLWKHDNLFQNPRTAYLDAGEGELSTASKAGARKGKSKVMNNGKKQKI